CSPISGCTTTSKRSGATSPSASSCCLNRPSPSCRTHSTSTTDPQRQATMKLFVIAVGHRMPGWVEQAWQDYARRLPPDCALELREIKPEPRSGGKTPAQMMQAEARRIEAAIPANALRIALDERGRDLTTRKLS